MVFAPYAVDAPMYRAPVANLALVGVTVVLTIVFWAYQPSHYPALDPSSPAVSEINPYMIVGGESSNLVSWVGYMFAHGGLLHLVGNMLFLFVFGNAVCAKMGHGRYLLLYFAGGLAAAAAQRVVSPGSMVGASGAINAVVGAYFLLFPLHKIRCYIFFFFRVFTYSVPGFVAILTWFAFDVWGAISGEERVAYGAHIGGFLFGAGVMALLLWKGWVEANDPGDETLFQAFERRLARRHELAARRSTHLFPKPAVSASRADPVTRAPPTFVRPSTPAGQEDDILEFGDPSAAVAPASRWDKVAAIEIPADGTEDVSAPPVSASRWSRIMPSQDVAGGEEGHPVSPSSISPERVRVSCGKCGRVSMALRRPEGGKGKCPACGDLIVIPPA